MALVDMREAGLRLRFAVDRVPAARPVQRNGPTVRRQTDPPGDILAGLERYRRVEAVLKPVEGCTPPADLRLRDQRPGLAELDALPQLHAERVAIAVVAIAQNAAEGAGA